MPANIGVDRRIGLVEPGPRPGDAVAHRDCRHARQAGNTRAAQGLQQQGFGLVTPVVGQQDERGTMGQRHLAQGAVAPDARPGLDALTPTRRTGEAAEIETDRETPA